MPQLGCGLQHAVAGGRLTPGTPWHRLQAGRGGRGGTAGQHAGLQARVRGRFCNHGTEQGSSICSTRQAAGSARQRHAHRSTERRPGSRAARHKGGRGASTVRQRLLQAASPHPVTSPRPMERRHNVAGSTGRAHRPPASSAAPPPPPSSAPPSPPWARPPPAAGGVGVGVCGWVGGGGGSMGREWRRSGEGEERGRRGSGRASRRAAAQPLVQGSVRHPAQLRRSTWNRQAGAKPRSRRRLINCAAACSQ